MYYYIEIGSKEQTTRHILKRLPDGGVQSFPDVESNTGPERQAYLAWVAEGNTAQEWSPEA
jgi:hypothetical protein